MTPPIPATWTALRLAALPEKQRQLTQDYRRLAAIRVKQPGVN